MHTPTTRLTAMSEEIRSHLTVLMQHSSIREWRNDPDSMLVFYGSPYSWNALDVEGRRLQFRLLEQYQHYWALMCALMSHQPTPVLKKLENARTTIVDVIEQPDSSMWYSTPEKALAAAVQALQVQVNELSSLPDAGTGEAYLVPDTNALIYNPRLEDWDFPSLGRFVLVLTPTVLAELDQLKITHREEAFRNKVEGLIRRIKGYRTRGRLAEGVNLRNDRSRLLSVATEPDFNKTISWLDAGNADDRVLATVIEVMRRFPRSAVLLVTRDINLQNKADHARTPFLEPPEPSNA